MKPTFDALRAGFPFDPVMGKNERTPCKKPDGSPSFVNQCAIRMGTALRAAGVLPKGGAGLAQCWFGHSGQGHVLRAEELGRWLAGGAAFGTPAKYKGKKGDAGTKALEAIRGKKGVVLILNFFGAGNSGDHIDLWTGTAMLGGDVSYLNDSKEIWFWELP
jgi:hypothetical protein